MWIDVGTLVSVERLSVDVEESASGDVAKQSASDDVFKESASGDIAKVVFSRNWAECASHAIGAAQFVLREQFLRCFVWFWEPSQSDSGDVARVAIFGRQIPCVLQFHLFST